MLAVTIAQKLVEHLLLAEVVEPDDANVVDELRLPRQPFFVVGIGGVPKGEASTTAGHPDLIWLEQSPPI